MTWQVFKVGEVIGDAKLQRQFGSHYLPVLSSRLESQERKNRQRRSYKITSPLPATEEDYKTLYKSKYTTTVGDLIGDAFSEIEALRDEMREAYDNMPESLQGGDIGSRRDEAANNLDGIADDQPDLCEDVEKLTVFFVPPKSDSRSARASAAADMLTTAANRIREHIKEVLSENTDYKTIIMDDEDETDLSDLADNLNDKASQLGEVDFPGMYG